MAGSYEKWLLVRDKHADLLRKHGTPGKSTVILFDGALYGSNSDSQLLVLREDGEVESIYLTRDKRLQIRGWAKMPPVEDGETMIERMAGGLAVNPVSRLSWYESTVLACWEMALNRDLNRAAATLIIAVAAILQLI